MISGVAGMTKIHLAGMVDEVWKTPIFSFQRRPTLYGSGDLALVRNIPSQSPLINSLTVMGFLTAVDEPS